VNLLQENDVSQGEIKCMIVCNATAYRESQNQGWINFSVFDGLKKKYIIPRRCLNKKMPGTVQNKLLKKMVMGMKIGSY